METDRSRRPVRTCVGCRTQFPQDALQRFVRVDDGAPPAWTPDPPGRRRPGRGAYLCSVACASRVGKNRRYPGLAAAAADLPADATGMYDRTAMNGRSTRA